MESIEKQFDDAMHDIYRRAVKEVGYKPSKFLDMLTKERGVATARKLIIAPTVSDGYTRLWEEQRLDLSVEAVVVDNPKWHPLFTEDELIKARKRLLKYGYQPKT